MLGEIMVLVLAATGIVLSSYVHSPLLPLPLLLLLLLHLSGPHTQTHAREAEAPQASERRALN